MPIIVVCCYLIGEIYKVILKKRPETYKLIPVLVSISGGILGILIYLTNKEMILNASNVWIALGIGIVSGASSTGTNQVVKQLIGKEKKKLKMKEKEKKERKKNERK